VTVANGAIRHRRGLRSSCSARAWYGRSVAASDTTYGDVVLYDGTCGLCSRAVRFIAGHDRAGRFRFAALGSDIGDEILHGARVPPLLPDSVILVEADGAVLVESDAALEILAHLDGPARHLARLRVVPRALRDGAYRTIARTRYRIFGRHDVCELPAPWLRERFLDA
jgi:predicted DCC family thiol-disulfide oxidoreductase YuxK